MHGRERSIELRFRKKNSAFFYKNAIYLRISCPIFNNFTFSKGLSIDLYEYPKYAKINAI